jgi:hypothetical protein
MVDEYFDTLIGGMSFIILLPGDTLLQFMMTMGWLGRGYLGSWISWLISLVVWAIVAGVVYYFLGLKDD